MSDKGQLTANFHIREFKCNDGTKVPEELFDNVKELAENLQVLRDDICEALHINSAYRHKIYNDKIGGSPKSKHLEAEAADLVSKSFTPKQLAARIKKLILAGKMKQGGVGIYKSFVHYDIRGTEARWTQ
jgi:uncharacterized protein YcbK (DUF882 family)